MDSAASIEYIQHLSYLGIFVAMVTTGYLIPLPEEIILLVSGYLIGTHLVNPVAMLVVSILGAIVGDTLIYYVCHHGSRFGTKLRARVENGYFKKYIFWFRKHTGRSVFTTRFIPGVRFVSPVISGLLNIPWRVFIFYNALAALIFVPLVTFIGYVLRGHISYALHVIHIFRHSAFIVAIAAVLCVLSALFVRAMFTRA